MGGPGVEVDRPARTRPGDEGLAPAESFDAFTLRLNVWFDTSRPATYRLRVRFAAESGLGEGTSNGETFLLPEPTRPEAQAGNR